MINRDKWIGSLPNVNTEFNKITNQLDHDRWINTIPKKNTYSSVKKNTYSSVKKYSIIVTLFVCGLLFVSAIKNETRNLQKIINNLEASINVIKFNLDQAILDNEIITSPENISLLAKEYLSTDLASYKRSQIKRSNDQNKKFTKINEIRKEKINKKKIKNLSDNIKTQIAKKVDKKKTEIIKLQELYSNPKSIPNAVKTQIATKIEEEKVKLKNIYNSPKDIMTFEKIGKWSMVQVVKVFLGMPVIPGR